MFVNNINPVLFKLGIFEIRYYGIAYALGFIIAYFFLRHYIKKGKLKGIEKSKIDDLILYLILGVVLGARLFYFIFYEPIQLLKSPLEFFMTWKGGLSFHGGLIGAIISIFLFCRKNKVHYLHLSDALVIPASLVLALGRIANFTNQELIGPVTNVPWCVQFTAVDSLCRHPYQIYASISHLILFFILIYIYNNQKKEGTSFWSFIFIYGIFRLITDFWKEELIFILGMKMGQILSLAMIVFALAYVIYKRINKKKGE
jgi:phosphatidylglycerol:prolipoprotein diacylglycerol transferase